MDMWANRITVKKEIRKPPFELVYGTQARMPLQNLLLVYNFILQEDLNILDPMEERMEQLAKLDEIRRMAQNQNEKLQS